MHQSDNTEHTNTAGNHDGAAAQQKSYKRPFHLKNFAEGPCLFRQHDEVRSHSVCEMAAGTKSEPTEITDLNTADGQNPLSTKLCWCWEMGRMKGGEWELQPGC